MEQYLHKSTKQIEALSEALGNCIGNTVEINSALRYGQTLGRFTGISVGDDNFTLQLQIQLFELRVRFETDSTLLLGTDRTISIYVPDIPSPFGQDTVFGIRKEASDSLDLGDEFFTRTERLLLQKFDAMRDNPLAN